MGIVHEITKSTYESSQSVRYGDTLPTQWLGAILIAFPLLTITDISVKTKLNIGESKK